MKVKSVWLGDYRTRIEDDRGHVVLTDLDREEGGDDAGTSALSLSVYSLAGCISTIFALVAERRRLPFESLSVDLDALRPKGARTITAVEGTVRVTSSAPAGDVETALALTVRTCPVGVLFDLAGIPVRVRYDVQPVPVAVASVVR